MRPVLDRPLRLVLLLGSLASVLAPASAQSTWTKQAPLPTSEDVYALATLSPDVLWIAGSTGRVLRTTDGGAHWSSSTLGTNSLHAIHFLDAQRGWAAGNGFFHTTDGGATWTKDNAWGSIYDLHFVDAQRGWACGNGGVTYRTTNGGSSWAFQPVGTPTTLSSIFFVDASNGWTVDIDGRIYRSANGGQSWTLAWNAQDYLSTVQFFDLQEGWAIGGDTFLRTTDGGQSWTPAPVPSGTWSHGARFAADRLHGISVGEYGNVTVTSDGGQSWTTIAEIGSGPRLWDVEGSDALHAAYSGETGGLRRTADGGLTWQNLQSGGAGATHAIDAVDGQNAWAANDGGEILRTEDGVRWDRVAVDGFDVYGRLADVDFVDLQQGWAVGRHEFFGGGYGRIVRSDDGGRTWGLQHQVFDGYLHSVEALDAQTAFVTGEVPLGPRFLLRTTNGGQNWVDVSPSLAVFRDTDFVDASTGWTVGGLIYKTTDGGQSWTQQHAPPDLLYSVSFADAQHGWACGWGPTLLHTDDGGQTWTPQSAPSSSNVYFRVRALSATTAWLAGNHGFVARTTNGGQSWVPETVPQPDNGAFEALCFLDEESGWLGGPGIWRRGDVSVGAPFCFGDGSAAACPCGNAGVAGHGCDNSSATGGARLAATGSPSLVADTLVLTSSDEIAGVASVFLQGTTAIQPVPFGDGLRCVAGQLNRLYVHFASGGTASAPVGSDPSVSARSAALGDAITAGSSRWYQVYYRDPVLAFCATPQGNSWNASSGVRVQWAP